VYVEGHVPHPPLESLPGLDPSGLFGEPSFDTEVSAPPPLSTRVSGTAVESPPHATKRARQESEAIVFTRLLVPHERRLVTRRRQF
jgi:hypothetical protein